MKCNDVCKLLVALADGQISRSAQQQANAHLASCAECRQMLEALRSDVVLLRQEEEPAVPGLLSARIMARVRESRPGLRLQPRLAAVAAAVLAAVGIWLGASLGRVIFRQEYEFRDRVAVTECGLPFDGLADQLFGE